MKILFIGDIFASPGRQIVYEHYAKIIAQYQVDLSIANVENSAGGFGVTPQIAEEMLALGLDVLTSGNHIWDKREIYDYLNRQPRLLRPANYAEGVPGRGDYSGVTKSGIPFAVLNLQGRVYMPATSCPFREADRLLDALDPQIKIRFVDFHAEVTSEKVSMGWHLDGRVTAVVGTHTHVPTADTRVLPQGTAYQTDCGMTGPYDGVIGVDKELILQKFLTSLPVRMEAAKQQVELHAVLVDADESTGRARSISRLQLTR
jgi:metallophosphoesterase (TIGR00282 family)